MKQQHILSVLVENSPGVLTHISSLLSRRGINISSIAASSTEEPDITRISLVVEVSDYEAWAEILNQLENLIQVTKVIEMTNESPIARELSLIKVKASPDQRAEITNVTDIFRARIVDVHPESMVIELTGESQKVDAFCDLMQRFGIIEIIRTGSVFMSRAPEAAAE